MIDVKQLDENFMSEILKAIKTIADGAPRSIKRVIGEEELHTIRSSDVNTGIDINDKDLPSNFNIELNDGTTVNYFVRGYHAIKSPVSSLSALGGYADSILRGENQDLRGKEFVVYPELALPAGVNDPEFKSLPAYRVFVSFVDKNNTIDLNDRIANHNPDYVQKFEKQNFDMPEIDNLTVVDKSSNKNRTTLPSFDAPYVKVLSIPATVTDIGDMAMHSITYCDFSGSKMIHVGNVSFYDATNIDWLFRNATALQDVKSIDMKNVYSAEGVFEGCTSLKDGGVHLKNVPKKLDLSKIGCDASKYVVDNYIDDSVNEFVMTLTDSNHSIGSMYSYDMRCKLTHIPEKLDTSNLTDFSGIFQGLSVLEKIPTLDMSKAENTSYMFSSTHITDFPEWLNMNKVTNAKGMFNGCGYLKPTKAINTESVIDMSGMFCGTSFDTIPEFSTKQAKNLSNLFNGNYRLVELPWAIDLSSAENVGNMFQNAKNTKDNGFHLKNVPRSLDLSKIGIAAGKYVIDNYID